VYELHKEAVGKEYKGGIVVIIIIFLFAPILVLFFREENMVLSKRKAILRSERKVKGMLTISSIFLHKIIVEERERDFKNGDILSLKCGVVICLLILGGEGSF